jgi:hypothetical protein
MTGNKDAAKCLKADAAFLGCKVDRAFTATQAITTFIGGWMLYLWTITQ